MLILGPIAVRSASDAILTFHSVWYRVPPHTDSVPLSTGALCGVPMSRSVACMWSGRRGLR